jgi:hypothetical protein
LPEIFDTWNEGVSNPFYFLSDTLGYVVHFDLFQTKDQGLTWDTLNLGYDSYMRGVYVNSEGNGWIVGNDGLLIRGIDFWSSHSQEYLGSQDLRDITFSQSGIGFIGGGGDGLYVDSGAFVYSSTDQGATWIEEIIDSGRISALETTSSYVFAVGRYGRIYRRALNTFTGIQLLENTTEVNIYPNPATESIQIAMEFYKTPDRLAIYSMNGKLIAQAENASIISVGDLDDGLYVLHIHLDSIVKKVKFIKSVGG